MREKRIYVECDRCKTSITLRKQNVVQGVTLYEEAERWIREGGKDFCPECAKVYQKLMKDFYE